MPARLVRPPGQHLGHNPHTPAPRRLVSGAPAPARAAPTPPRAAAADGPSADTAAAVADLKAALEAAVSEEDFAVS